MCFTLLLTKKLSVLYVLGNWNCVIFSPSSVHISYSRAEFTSYS
uniref:Uncharacterized protein n=1 Tax=Arundo donax TaxID=35708 RepID=A0A0A8YCK6_ARUDO